MDMYLSQTFNSLEENHWQCREVGMYRTNSLLVLIILAESFTIKTFTGCFTFGRPHITGSINGVTNTI